MLRRLDGLVLAMSIAAGGVAHGQTELIVNGGFETGNLNGWSMSNSGLGNWLINDGTADPFGPATPVLPITGNFDAKTSSLGAGVHMLYQSFIVPDNVGAALLSFDDRIQNFAADFNDPGHEFRVVIFDGSLNPLAVVFSTDPGDPTQQFGPNLRMFDVTAPLQTLAGEVACLGFVQQDSLDFFNVTIDNVSLQVGEAPPPELVEVPVDVKPGSDRNPINIKQASGNGGVLPVAVLSTDDFDARLVDDSSVELGDPNLSGVAVPLRVVERDVDSDGDMDLLFHFSLCELVDVGAIDCESEELLLTGATFDGVEVFGVDLVDPH